MHIWHSGQSIQTHLKTTNTDQSALQGDYIKTHEISKLETTDWTTEKHKTSFIQFSLLKLRESEVSNIRLSV